MDRYKSASNIIKLIIQSKENPSLMPDLIKSTCQYFDELKDEDIASADFHFLRYIANATGIPQYYEMLSKFQEGMEEREPELGLDILSMLVAESSLHTSESVQLHRYQKKVLDSFSRGERNRIFLSATTSFGKTYLVYEVIRKMQYKHIALIFPTISLLSENLFKIYTDENYQWIKDKYNVYTLSETIDKEEDSILILTPERYLSFLDKNSEYNSDFVFVDEIYKVDNEFIIDEEAKENERDVAYRLALHELLSNADTDALFVGPYIVFDRERHSSFERFLQYYGFTSFCFNQYDIVDKKEILIHAARQYYVEDNFCLQFTPKASTNVKRVELISQLLERDESTIVYCGYKSGVENLAKLLIESDFGDIDTTPFDDFLTHLCSLYNKEGRNWIVTKALRKGIGIHHGLVPKYIQNEIIRLFNANVIKLLLCTTTITEGVNTSAKNMVVLASSKGGKPLKKFDAQNIEGRAGRFMQHYEGRVFILDKKFDETLKQPDEPLGHKHFDRLSDKKDVDLQMVQREYLNEEQQQRWCVIKKKMQESGIPEQCFKSFKTIPPEDKILLYGVINRFSDADFKNISLLISKFTGLKRLHRDGMELICRCIRPIVVNGNLKYLIENGRNNSNCCFLVDMIDAFVRTGFSGSANYYIQKYHDVDKGIKQAANFVFVTLRYQVVKYFGLFNLIYKFVKAERTNIEWNDVPGLESLLMRLEFSADTPIGRKASDVGSSFDVIRYFDSVQLNPNEKNQRFSKLDDFEKRNVEMVNRIID